jgi:aspartate kinase
VTVDEEIAKVTVVGIGMKTESGVAAGMFRVLADNGINIEMISTSPIRISCVIRGDQVDDAVKALHTGFGLDREPGS